MNAIIHLRPESQQNILSVWFPRRWWPTPVWLQLCWFAVCGAPGCWQSSTGGEGREPGASVVQSASDCCLDTALPAGSHQGIHSFIIHVSLAILTSLTSLTSRHLDSSGEILLSRIFHLHIRIDIYLLIVLEICLFIRWTDYCNTRFF